MASEPLPPASAVRQVSAGVELVRKHRAPVITFVVTQIVAGRALEIILPEVRIRCGRAWNELIGINVEPEVAAAGLTARSEAVIVGILPIVSELQEQVLGQLLLNDRGLRVGTESRGATFAH